MKGPSYIVRAAAELLIIAIIVNVSQIEALTPEQTCLLVQNNTYIGDPGSCQGWVFCRSGKAIYGKCNENLYFDSATGVCDYPENVDCTLSSKTICDGLTDIYKADPSDCSKYCYCNNGKAECNKCPTGQYYDPISVSCVWSSTSNCVANSPCQLAPNGFIGDGKTCTGYYRCGSGRIVTSGNCESGLYYNANKGICDYPENVKCSSSPSKPATPNEPIPPKDTCKNAAGFFDDKETCRGYFSCPSKGSTATWGQCPKNSNFDPKAQECVDPEKVVCTKDRCDGSSNAFMAVANTNCRKYYNCQNGVATAQGTCPSDHPYFDELGGVCQINKLDYPICK